MFENKLRQRLQQVARRFRARQWWLIVAVIALLDAVIGAAMLPGVRAGRFEPASTAMVLLISAAVALFIAFIINMRSHRNPAPIARKIEAKFPTLQQRLLTAISFTEDPAARSGYLQQQVLREACDHSQDNAWTETVPRRQVWASRLSGCSAMAIMIFVLGVMVFKPQPTPSALASIPRQTLHQITVTPGDTEVERGTNLLVTARFEGIADVAVPSDGELQIVTTAASEIRLPMKRNLRDPVLGGLISSISEPFQYQVLTPDWTSPTYSVDVFEFPELVRSDASLSYPTYTKFPDKTIEDTRRVSAVQGTSLRWKFQLNKPVVSASLVSKQGETISLHLDDSFATAETDAIVIDASQRYTLDLVDDKGRQNKYPPELIVRMLPNQPPKLKMTAGGDVRVSPLQEFSVAAETEDDYGIERFGLTSTFNGKPYEVVLATNIERGRKRKVEHLIELESLDAKPDQLLIYHLWAEDIGPDGNVRRTRGDMYFAEVRHFEEIFREGEPPPGGEPSPPSENEQQAEQLAESQKEVIAATWRVLRDGLTAEFKANVESIAEAQRSQMESLDTLAEKLQDEESLQFVAIARGHMQTAVERLRHAGDNNDLDSLNEALGEEQLSYEGLLKLRAREFEVTRSQQQQSQSSSSAAQQRQQQLNDLELKQDENRYETEKQAQPDTAAEQQQREERQVLSRLKELAKRQEDINKQVAQLQSALEMAETEEEQEEIQRQLKRLRDQQQELLRELDDLDQRMQSPENQSSMQEESEQLAETRENVRQAAEALQENDASKALSAGKRAERELEQMRDEFRQRTASQFNDAVREMRDDASQLDDRQQELAEQLKQQLNDPSPGLRAANDQKQLEQDLQSQRDRLSDLQQKMQETVEQAETAEPLLAESLYDSFRRTQQRQVDERLNETSQLLQNGFAEEASQAEEQANEGIRELKEGLEKAASSVLGDETEALRRAASELEQLSRDLENEIQSATQGPRAKQQAGPGSATEEEREGGENQPNEMDPSRADANSDAEPQEESEEQSGQGEPGSGKPGPGQPGQRPPGAEASQPGQSLPGLPGMGPPGNGEADAGEPTQTPQSEGESSASTGQPGQGQQPNQSQSGSSLRSSPGSQNPNAAEQTNSPSAAPIAGDGFRQWSDQLRDVEEMVDDPEIRSRAARIRDRARDVRTDLLRHSQTPKWELVEEMIAAPLRELQRDVQEEWIRRSAEKNALVPIDRDPVPSEFSGAVREYYERLGSGK